MFIVFSALPFTDAISFGPQGRKVMSSSARSFPIPPGALFVMRITTLVIDAGVLKLKPYWVHTGLMLTGMSPVLNVPSLVPSVCSILKVIFGRIEFWLSIIFSIQAANSYVVFPQSPSTCCTKKSLGVYEAFTSIK